MKSVALVFTLSLLGCAKSFTVSETDARPLDDATRPMPDANNATDPPDAMGQPDAGLPSHPVPYREVHRTYSNLRALDLTECEDTYRFLHGNWMDCVVSLDTPSRDSIVRQLSAGNLPRRNFQFRTGEPDVVFHVGVTRDCVSEGCFLGTRLWFTGYYMRVGVLGILRASPEDYSESILEHYIHMALENLSTDLDYATTLFALSGGDFSPTHATDRIVGDIFTARRTVAIDVGACGAVYANEQVDDKWDWPLWHWQPTCRVTLEPARTAPPWLPISYGTDSYAQWARSATNLAITIPEEDAVVHIMADNNISGGFSGYEIWFELIGQDVELAWSDAERLLNIARARVPEVTWPELLRSSDLLHTLRQGESVVGRLVMFNNKIDIEEAGSL